MFQKLKQFKELRSQAKSLQKKLAQETVHHSAGGDKVHIILDGNQQILSVEVDPSLLAIDQQQKLQNAVKDAVNGAMKKLQATMARKMQKGEIEIPDLSGLKK